MLFARFHVVNWQCDRPATAETPESGVRRRPSYGALKHFNSGSTESREYRMYCSDCGTQLPERANFCWQCGKAQNTAAKTSKVQEETCEIDFEHVAYRVFSNRWKFWAKAIGSSFR